MLIVFFMKGLNCLHESGFTLLCIKDIMKFKLNLLSAGLLLSGLAAPFSCFANEEAAAKKSESEQLPKVLYVTHEPGKYHDYVGQREAFEEIAQTQAWETTILSKDHDELLEYFEANEDFAKGYDVVIYNICMAKTENTTAAYNVMKQTKEHGVNAFLIHCALHSFWPTFDPKVATDVDRKQLVKKGLGGALVSPRIIKEWEEKHPDKEFPVWGDFCGCASVKHGNKVKVNVTKLIDHEAAQGVKDKYKIGKSELYLTYYQLESASVILHGVDKQKKSAPVLWEMPVNDAKMMAYSLGHYTAEWKAPDFRSVFTNSVNYLAKKN